MNWTLFAFSLLLNNNGLSVHQATIVDRFESHQQCIAKRNAAVARRICITDAQGQEFCTDMAFACAHIPGMPVMAGPVELRTGGAN